MKAVSDTSPICYLLLLGQIEILPKLFETVVIPQAVRQELEHPGADRILRDWIVNAPSWLEVAVVPARSAPDLDRLHAGEREALLLAESIQADVVIVDERKARQAAQARGLQVTGLLGVLDQAAERGLLSLPDVVESLQRTNFRAEPRLLRLLLDRRLR